MGSIVGHSVNQFGDLYFTIETDTEGAKLTEKREATETLGYGPEDVEVYQYFYNDFPGHFANMESTTRGPLQYNIQNMIANYIDAGHFEAALDIIESTIAAKRKPSISVILSLIDLLLRPKVVHRRCSKKELLFICTKAQRMLFHILENFGPEAFDNIWYLFRSITAGRLHQRQLAKIVSLEIKDEDDEEPYKCSLSEFEDFWDLLGECVNFRGGSKKKTKEAVRPSLQAPGGHKRRRMVLGFLLTLLETDLRSRQGSREKLEKCIFLSLIRTDGTGQRTQLDRYLDILFTPFGYQLDSEDVEKNETDAESIDYAGRLMNMLVIMSYCHNLISVDPLIEQSYRKFLKLSAEGCASFIQVVRCTTYISSLLDKVLTDADCSAVNEKLMPLRKANAYSLAKLLNFNIRTKPLQLHTMEDVYRHVMIITWRFMSFVSEKTMRCDVCQNECIRPKVIWALDLMDQEASFKLMTKGPMSLTKLRRHVDNMMDRVRGSGGMDEQVEKEYEKKINWALQLIQLSMTT